MRIATFRRSLIITAATLALTCANGRGAGSIGGRVTSAGGSPLDAVWLLAYDSAGNWADGAITDTNGQYQIAGLTNGGYYVQTYDPGAFYIDEWYDNVVARGYEIPSSAALVAVSNAALTNISFSLTLGGSISGRVTDAIGAPLSNVWVDAYDTGGVLAKSGFSETNGSYTIPALPEGGYFVRTEAFGANYADEWFSDVPVTGADVPASARLVLVIGAAVTGHVDFALARGAAIAGRVTDETLAPIAGVWVDVYQSGGDWQASAASAANGAYRAEKLPAGTFHARTYVGSLDYADEWYTNVPVLGFDVPTNVAPIALAAGATASNADFALAAGGALSGAVTNAAGAPVAGAAVDVYESRGLWVRTATVGSTGAYRAAGLPAGLFLVRTAAGALNYVDEWYDGVTAVGTAVPAAAQVLSVTAGASVAHVDFGLAAGGAIAGRVADASNSPLAQVDVNVYDADGDWRRGGVTATGGAYVVSGLPEPGPYYAVTEASRFNYVDLWYSGVPTGAGGIPSNAYPIGVMAGCTTSNVDFALPAGGCVSGRVVTPPAAPLEAVLIQVYASNGTLAAEGETAADGAYGVKGLPAGEYYVRTDVGDLNYVDEWYDNAAVAGLLIPAGATPLPVWPGSIATNVSFSLSAGGVVTGRVSDTLCAPLNGVALDLFDPATNWIKAATTAGAGAYRVQGLPTQSLYYVRTHAAAVNCLDEWYDDAPVAGGAIPAAADPVAVSTAAAAAANFVLRRGGAVSGTVADVVGSPLAEISVDLYDTNGLLAASADTDGAGLYAIRQLSPARYYLRTFSGSWGFLDEWYDDLPAGGNGIPSNAVAVVLGEGGAACANFGLRFALLSCGASTNGPFWVRWNAASGTTYQVELTTNLAAAWSNAPSGSNAFEQGLQTAPFQGVMEYRAPRDGRPNGAYRVRSVP